jgi:hypothetical protein
MSQSGLQRTLKMQPQGIVAGIIAAYSVRQPQAHCMAGLSRLSVIYTVNKAPIEKNKREGKVKPASPPQGYPFSYFCTLLQIFHCGERQAGSLGPVAAHMQSTRLECSQSQVRSWGRPTYCLLRWYIRYCTAQLLNLHLVHVLSRADVTRGCPTHVASSTPPPQP